MDTDQRRNLCERRVLRWHEYALCRFLQLHLRSHCTVATQWAYSAAARQRFIDPHLFTLETQLMDPSNLPLEWAYYLSIFGFLCLFVVIWLIPKKAVFEDAPDQSRWRDLRLWAAVLIAFQLVIYAVFN